jgi:protoporphyrinogen/coproporphyrinogen III oxidase
MTPPRVVVAGGGITGLVTAFTLREEAARLGLTIDLCVLDAASEPGGHARTIREDGFVVERGPNGFLDRGAETMALIAELSLGDRVVEANQAAKRRFILNRGTLRQVPESPPALITSDAIGWRGKLRLLREPWAAAPPPGLDETVFQFAERRLGREAAETFVDTAVAGISAGDSRALSVRSQFPMLKTWENEHGSLLKAMLARQKSGAPRARLLSFDHGLGTLTSKLASQLDGIVRGHSSIERVEKVNDRWSVSVSDGSTVIADHLIMAMPSHAAARVAAGVDRELSEVLSSIPYADMTMVALAYKADAIARPLNGYGYLVTRREDLSTLGVLWESSIFPNRAPDGSVLLRVMLGGARRPEVSAFDDRTVAALAIKEVSQVLGISGGPVRQWICRWPSAIAQYTVGHDSRTATIRRLAAAHRGLHLCGTAYDGVSFNDAIASGRKTARAVAQELAA